MNQRLLNKFKKYECLFVLWSVVMLLSGCGNTSGENAVLSTEIETTVVSTEEVTVEEETTEEIIENVPDFSKDSVWKQTVSKDNTKATMVLYKDQTGVISSTATFVEFVWNYKEEIQTLVITYPEEETDWLLSFSEIKDGYQLKADNGVTFKYLDNDIEKAQGVLDANADIRGDYEETIEGATIKRVGQIEELTFNTPIVIVDDENVKCEATSIVIMYEAGTNNQWAAGFYYDLYNKTEHYLRTDLFDGYINDEFIKFDLSSNQPSSLAPGKKVLHCFCGTSARKTWEIKDLLSLEGELEIILNDSATSWSSSDYTYRVDYSLDCTKAEE